MLEISYIVGAVFTGVIGVLGARYFWSLLFKDRQDIREKTHEAVRAEAGRTRTELLHRERAHERDRARMAQQIEAKDLELAGLTRKYTELVADSTQWRTRMEMYQRDNDRLTQQIREMEALHAATLDEMRRAISEKDAHLAHEKQRIAEIIAGLVERKLADLESI